MSRRVTKMQIPHSNAVMTTRSKIINGKGMGSVLLSVGGPGAASSYMDMDDYIATTGINPNTRTFKPASTAGTGMSKLSEKLNKLKINEGPRRKNITMSF